ncbi:hypothetical protein OAS39_07770 [Pirellulales bacterium]|nr:hypothetical protein [Pirellulales bacterium]
MKDESARDRTTEQQARNMGSVTNIPNLEMRRHDAAAQPDDKYSNCSGIKDFVEVRVSMTSWPHESEDCVDDTRCPNAGAIGYGQLKG